MKNKIILIALVIIALCLPIFSHAYGDVSLSTSSYPTTAPQGGDVIIYITAQNDTNESIVISDYSVNGMFYILELTEVLPGHDFVITKTISVDFLGSDYAVINPISIGYYTITNQTRRDFYGDDVVIYRENSAVANSPVDTSLSFDISADNTNIEAGTWVNYTFTCKNIGNTDYFDFIIYTTEESTNITVNIPVGETRVINFSKQYFNTTTDQFGYFFYYKNGDTWFEEEIENAKKIDITVNPSGTQQFVPTPTLQPTSTPQPTNAPTPAPQPASPTPKPTNTPTPAPQPTNTPACPNDPNSTLSLELNQPDQPSQPKDSQSVDSNQQSKVVSNTQDASKEQSSAVATNANQKKSSPTRTILYIVAGLVVIGLFVVLVILLKRLRDQ